MAKIMNTTAPATAWLCWWRTPPRNVGASALKMPSTGRQRTPPPRRRRTRRGPMLGEAEAGKADGEPLTSQHRFGTHATTRAATAKKPRYTSNTSTVGRGKYCANRPAISGPRPSPPVLTTVETMEARRGFAGPSMSVSAAVAVPVMRPAENPDRTRPKKEPPHGRGDDEHHRAEGAERQSGPEYRSAPDLVGSTSGEDQGGQHARRVGGEDQGDHPGGKVPLALPDDVEGGG